MPVRPTMLPLISRLRRMIADQGDSQGAGQVFSDDDLADTLEPYQAVVRYLPLTAEPTYPPGGGPVLFLDFYAPFGDWEEDARLCTVGWFPIVADDVSDFRTGRWAFTQSQTPTIYLTGKTYDLAGAAADALEAWAGRVKLKYDFASADQKLTRSQQFKALMDLAGEYRAKQRAVSGTLVRSDLV